MSVTVERLVAEIEADPTKAIAGLATFDAALTAATKDRKVSIDVDKGRGFDDLASSLAGGGLSAATEGLGNLTDAASGAAGGLSEVAGAAGGAGGSLSQVGTAASGASGPMMSFAGAIGNMLGGLISSLPIIAAYAAAITLLPGALAAAAAAAGALLAALAPLVGLLGAVVPLMGALGAVIGTVAAVVMPVMGAFQALGAAQKQNGIEAVNLAGRERDLAAAYRGVHEAAISLVRAERELHDAREALAKAPMEAAEALEEQHFAMTAAILNEKQAVLSLQNAQKNLSDLQNEIARSGLKVTQQVDEFSGKVYDVAVNSDDAATNARDLRAATLQIAQAELAVAQAKDNTGDQQRKLNEMMKKGIKNSDVMVAAQRRLVDATFALQRAQDGVAASHDRVAEAQKRLAEGTADTSAATRNLADAMAKLTPIGQDFVYFLKNDFVSAFGDISKIAQDTMLPGVKRGLQGILDFLPTIEKGVGMFGRTIGRAFGDFFQMWAEPAQQDVMLKMFRGINRVLGLTLKIAQPLSRVLGDIMIAAEPLTEKLLGGLTDGLQNLADWMETDKGKKKVLHFFNRAGYFLGLWLDVLKPLGGILTSVLDAATPLAKDILKDLAGYFGDINKHLKGSGFKDLRRWFNDQQPSIELFADVLSDIGDLLFNSTQGGKDSAFYQALQAIKDLIPDVKDLFKRMDETDFAAGLISALGTVVDLMAKVFPPAEKAKPGDGHPSQGEHNLSTTITPKIDWQPLQDSLRTGFQNAIKGTLTWLWTELRGLFFDAPLDGFDSAMAFIGHHWLRGAKIMMDQWEQYVQKPIREWLSKVGTSFMEDFIKPIGAAFGNVWQFFEDGWTRAIIAIAHSWNSTIGGMKLPDWLGGGKFPTMTVPDAPGTSDSNSRPDPNDYQLPGGSGNGTQTGPVTGTGKDPLDDTKNGRGVVINQTFNTPVDPHHVAREIAWAI